MVEIYNDQLRDLLAEGDRVVVQVGPTRAADTLAVRDAPLRSFERKQMSGCESSKNPCHCYAAGSLPDMSPPKLVDGTP